jgi:ssDNA-binding Zn-finger/Zn-ribbon topoisomerase 1
MEAEELLNVLDRIATALEGLNDNTRDISVSLSAMSGTKYEKTNTPNCPKCGDPMVQKANRSNGSLFWGCQNYPDCRATRPMAGEAKRSGGGSEPDDFPF